MSITKVSCHQDNLITMKFVDLKKHMTNLQYLHQVQFLSTSPYVNHWGKLPWIVNQVFFNISVDLDECQVVNGGCEHTCVNTYGSYYCECDDGYSLNEDKHTCTREYMLQIQVHTYAK